MQQKPYDKCLFCPNLGVSCDGPNFLAMTNERRIEWAQKRKNDIGKTNAQIAEESGIPKGTIDRILSGHGGDVRISTMAPILKTLVGGTWGQYPCHDPEGAQIDEGSAKRMLEDKDAEIERLRRQLGSVHESYAAELRTVREEAQRKIDFVKEDIKARDSRIAKQDEQLAEHRKIIKGYRRLIAFLAVPSVLFVAYLVYDAMHPDFGVVSSIIEMLRG